jgi:hypothetical protein
MVGELARLGHPNALVCPLDQYKSGNIEKWGFLSEVEQIKGNLIHTICIISLEFFDEDSVSRVSLFFKVSRKFLNLL